MAEALEKKLHWQVGGRTGDRCAHADR